MKKILIDQCLQCWHFDDDTFHCRQTGERLLNPYVIPPDCPLEVDLPESKEDWIPVSERLPKPIMRNGYFGFKFLFYTEDQRRVSYYENFMWGNIEVANESLKIFLAKSKIANWQPLPAVPQERGETK